MKTHQTKTATPLPPTPTQFHLYDTKFNSVVLKPSYFMPARASKIFEISTGDLVQVGTNSANQPIFEVVLGRSIGPKWWALRTVSGLMQLAQRDEEVLVRKNAITSVNREKGINPFNPSAWRRTCKEISKQAHSENPSDITLSVNISGAIDSLLACVPPRHLDRAKSIALTTKGYVSYELNAEASC